VKRTWITHRSPQLDVQLLRDALGHRPSGDDDLVVSDGRGDLVPAGSDRQVVGIADSGHRGETARYGLTAPAVPRAACAGTDADGTFVGSQFWARGMRRAL
jgi:hypothetical protein